jgi:hypothetical protein
MYVHSHYLLDYVGYLPNIFKVKGWEKYGNGRKSRQENTKRMGKKEKSEIDRSTKYIKGRYKSD